jgi:uncharacterized delta-60 repeat protein
MLRRPSPVTEPAPRLELEVLEAREVPALGLDPTFGTGGLALNPLAAVRFESFTADSAAPGGATVVAGRLVGPLANGTGGPLAVARLTPTGTADPTFGTGGVAQFSFPLNYTPEAVVVQPDGKILVGGTASTTDGGIGQAFVLRLNANGSLDTTFGANGDVLSNSADTLNRLALQPNGDIVFTGTTIPPAAAPPPNPLALPAPQLVVERLTSTGALDATFGTGGRVVGTDTNWSDGGLAIQPDGMIVVSGAVGPAIAVPGSGTPAEMTVLRFTSTGAPDTTFGTQGRAATHYGTFAFAYANDVALLPDGRIVVGGGSSYGQGLLAWFTPTGTLLSQEEFQGTSGGLPYIKQLIVMPQGGVEAIDGSTFEYHPAPGVVSGALTVNPGAQFLPGDVALGAGGTLIVSGLSRTGSLMDPTPGGSASAYRLVDPGVTQSSTTFVHWLSSTEVPTGPVALSAAVVPLLGTTPITDGMITFSEGSTVLGTLAPGKLPVDPVGQPSVLNVTLPPGDHTITATYSGSATWANSTATALFHVAETAATATALTVSSTNPAAGQKVQFTAGQTVQFNVNITRTDAGTPPAVGTVTYYDGTTVLTTGGVLIGGTSVMTTILSPGTHSIHVVYSGAPGYAASESAPVSVTVTAPVATTTRLGISLTSPVAGVTATLIATVQAPPGTTPTGNVTFSDGSIVLGSVPVGPNGVASLPITLKTGAHTFHTVYSGDAGTQGSTAPLVLLTVGRAPTLTGLTASSVTIAAGGSVTLTASVQATVGSTFPIGTVQFLDGSTVLGSASIDGTGRAKLVVSGLSAGTHAITAVYGGSSVDLGSTSGVLSVAVGSPVASAPALTSSVPNPVYGENQTLTAHMTSAVGAALTGRVAFYDGTALLGTSVLDGHGNATLSVLLNLGAHRLRAVTLDAAAGTSATLNETVVKAPTVLTLTTSGSTVRAQVSAVYAGSPIGTVTFMDGGKVLGTAPVNGNGVATFVLPPGPHQITAVYNGSSCFQTSTA